MLDDDPVNSRTAWLGTVHLCVFMRSSSSEKPICCTLTVGFVSNIQSFSQKNLTFASYFLQGLSWNSMQDNALTADIRLLSLRSSDTSAQDLKCSSWFEYKTWTHDFAFTMRSFVMLLSQWTAIVHCHAVSAWVMSIDTMRKHFFVPMSLAPKGTSISFWM